MASASNGTASTSSLVVPSPASPPSTSANPPPSASANPQPSSDSSPTIPSVAPTQDTPSSSALPPSSTQPAPSSEPVTEPSSSAVTTSATPDPPSSTPVSVPTTSDPPSSSQPPPSSENTPEPSTQQTTTAPPATTQTRTASTRPPTTQVITSVVTSTPTQAGETPTPVTIILTSTQPGETFIPTDNADPSPSPSNTDPASLQSPGASKAQSGLSTGGKTAIAVVVPVVVVALLVIAGILLWRRCKAKKNDAEARRKEVEEYGFNPNNDPTLPAVGMTSEMAEDRSGYRGWGNTTASSHAKGSTTLTSGNTYSDSNSNPGGYQSPGSPTNAYSDGHSSDPLVNGRRETLDSDGIGALGAAPVAANRDGVHRGPSNASSSYSGADRSDNSGDYPIPGNNPQEYNAYNPDNQYYHASSPYDNNAYAAGGQQPIIRDVSARRNTRIENPSVFPQQGNSGIAQNF